MKFEHVSWEKIEEYCLDICRRMDEDGYKPDVVIGLMRGGIVPARIFADYYDIFLDFFAVDVKLYDGIGVRKESPIVKPFHLDIDRNKNVLVVDDIFDSGKTMSAILDLLKDKNVKTATLFHRKSAKKKPDYFSVSVDDEWVVFAWEKSEFRRQNV